MRWLARVRMAMEGLFHRDTATMRLSDELEFHLEQQVAENIAQGMNADDARAAALKSFGNPALLRDEARASWSWNWLERSLRDIRYGVRTLSRSPGFAVTAVLVMALGIGATTALFTIVRAVLLRPLPFRDPDKLVMVYEHFRSNTSGDGLNEVSPADFREWNAQTHGFEEMAARRDAQYNMTGEHDELPEVVQGSAGSWNLFSLLGVKPVLGRAFTQEEDKPDSNRVAVLSWNLFQRRFAGDPSIVGKSIRLDSNAYTVIGVLPRWFNYPDAQTQLWVPYGSTFTPAGYDEHDNHQSNVIARMKPGVSATAATKEVSALQYQMHLEHPYGPVAEDAVSRPMIDDVVQDVKTPLIVLLCAVGCMLLIACLNVSNLLVARGAARRKEVAVRSALGGSRVALIREQMTESLLICVSGGVLGMALSMAATQWLATHWAELPRAETIRVDGEVLGFSLALVFLATLMAGLLPAISSTSEGVLSALQESSRSIGGSISRATLRKTMLTVEIALTVVLLVSAGLLFKSFVHMRTADLGCPVDHVLTIKYGLPIQQYDTREKVLAFHEGLLERVRRLPGVKSAGLVSTPPGGGWEGDRVFKIAERPSENATWSLANDAMVRTADPGYFAAMGIPVLRGRVFSEAERLTNDHYMVISKRLADQYFAGDDPIGKHILINTDKPNSFEIIGVVGDTLWSVAKPAKATIYFPILSGMPRQASFATIVLRTEGDPLAMAVPVQRQVAAMDASLPVHDVFTIEQIVGKETAGQSFSATLVLAFAGLSLLLAGVGLYGVLSYLVTQRVTEIGIRLALGAQRSQVLGLVLMDGLRPVLAGLVLGIAGGAAAGALIRSILYGTSPLDPGVFLAMVGTLLVTAAAACAVPAIRASRIEPMQALRME